MKKMIFIIATLVSTAIHAQTKWPAGVTQLQCLPNDSIIAEGNLSTGKVIADLSWASNSSNACFIAGQFPRFQGNHVFYGTTITSGSLMKIKATPVNKDEEISLYAYMVDENNVPLVPNLIQCISCEADYKRDKPMKGKTLSYVREVEFRNPTDRSYSIVIGVSAPKGVTERKFEVSIQTIL